jgi:hypothetical protein
MPINISIITLGQANLTWFNIFFTKIAFVQGFYNATLTKDI